MRRALGTMLLAVAVTAGACGDDADDGATVAPDVWAGTVCGEVAAAAEELAAALTVVDELPGQVEADAPLGEAADELQAAFLAPPDYVDRYRAVLTETPAPDTRDGVAFRDEVLADLDAAAATFGEAAEAAEAIGPDTTIEEFFGGAQAFAQFPEAFAAADLDFGGDAPPGVDEALRDEPACTAAQNRLVQLLG